MKVNKKIIIIIVAIVLLLTLITIKIAPTLGKIIFQRDKENIIIWDGTIANSFEKGKGSDIDPYIISTPNEFILMLDNKYNKENYYFKIDNNLYFNDGIFDYDIDNNNYIYYKKTNKYYLNDNDKYYSNNTFTEEKGKINIIEGLYNFKGNIDGQNNFLYGIYINNDNGCLFSKFSGNLKNIKIANSMIIGSNNISFIDNSTDTNISNIMFNSILISNNSKDNNISTSSFINNSINTTIDQFIFKGISKSNYTSSAIINNSNSSTITNSYNTGTIISSISSGLINTTTNKTKISNCYNNGDLQGNETNGIINESLDNSTIELNNIINFKNNTNNIIRISKNNIKENNIYTIYKTKGIGKQISKEDILNKDKLKELEYTKDLWKIEDNKIPVLQKDDNENPTIEIKYEDEKYSSIHEVKKIHIKDGGKFEFNADDKESDILKIEYYLDNTSKKLLDDYKNLNYQVADSVSLTDNGDYILYLKVTDTSGNITYANTDRLVLNNINLLVTLNNQVYKDVESISSDNIINYQIDSIIYTENKAKLYIESDEKLIDNTKITLVDINNNYKEYKYKVDNNDVEKDNNKYYYSFDLFNIKNNFKNKEKFTYTLKFDYSNVDFKKYESKISFVVKKDDEIISNTKEKDVKEIKIVKTKEKRYKIETDDKKINLNKLNNQNFKIKIKENDESIYYNYKLKDYRLVTYITCEDDLVKDENIKNNLAFNIYNNKYYIGKDGYSKIPITSYELKLNIETINTFNVIKDGNYYLNIKIYNDNNNKDSSNIIKIPITVTPDVYNDKYTFNVEVDRNNTYIDKASKTTYSGDKDLHVKIKYKGDFKEPKILLKVSKLINKNYEEINAKKYIENYYNTIDNKLELINKINSGGEYKIKLKLNYENFDIGTYKFEFLLYNSNNRVSVYETNIIVG